MHCDPTLLVLLLERKLGQHPVLLLFKQALDLCLLFINGEVKQAECVLKQAALDLIVKWRVSCETRRLIHLQQVRLAFVVEDDVEAENLEAHQVFQVRRLARSVVVRQLLLDRDKSLDYYILRLSHDFIRVQSILLESFKNLLQSALMTCIVVH